jgi:hypothetical protein
MAHLADLRGRTRVAEIFSLTAALGILGAAALIAVGSAALGLPLPSNSWCSPPSPPSVSCSSAPSPCDTCSGPNSPGSVGDALIGKPASVIQDVTGLEGRVRIGGVDERTTQEGSNDSAAPDSGRGGQHGSGTYRLR